MITKLAATFALTVLSFASLHAASLPSANEIIAKEGQLVFTDGSSCYDFEKDGTFTLCPLGWSGRTITRYWRSGDALFEVSGRWAWSEGPSYIEDNRRMTMLIIPQPAQTVEPPLANNPAIRKEYHCYFEIEQLISLPPFDAADAIRDANLPRPIPHLHKPVVGDDPTVGTYLLIPDSPSKPSVPARHP